VGMCGIKNNSNYLTIMYYCGIIVLAREAIN